MNNKVLDEFKVTRLSVTRSMLPLGCHCRSSDSRFSHVYFIIIIINSKMSWCERYKNKIILAPMVRIGTLPARLLAIDYGADLVYSEEIIDFRLLRSKRSVNTELGTIDFIDNEDVVVFRTCCKEKDKVIIQLGTADPDRALAAAKIV